jgi:NO-binding membrane sensor protein with MHYT domain
MFTGHNLYLVALSMIVAIMGGYTGFGLAATLRDADVSRRPVLAGAACLLAIGIWTMHFVGMLAAPIPADAVYLVLPTIVSFLICALVVGISLFIVSIGEPTDIRIISSAFLLGLGIVSMHYVGIHALQGNFSLEHQPTMILLAALIAVGAAYGGLRIFLARQGGARLLLSATAFGLAVSGMHYTAMYGMRFLPGIGHGHELGGLAASSQVLALVVALLCFLIIAALLLFLVPEARPPRAVAAGPIMPDANAQKLESHGAGPKGSAQRALPLRGLGQPPIAYLSRLPIESADGTQFIDAGEVRSVRADAHYTMIHDGNRERMCLWSISEAEAQLDPASFIRVHRSHIIALSHVSLMRKEGDGAVVKLDGAIPHLVPVSRAKIAELKARLGLLRRSAVGPNAS